MRIARPMLLVSTPIGVVLGVREAWRLAGPRMALLMVAMVGVVGAFVWWTVLRIRQEHEAPSGRRPPAPADAARRPASLAPVHQPQPGETEGEADRIR